ncbi:Serine/threonine-protein kinase [Hordeum vulgare]|nr:Serine/threonine-protein kinase [Hordeum vulgare]
MVENSINSLEQPLAEDDKYNVVGFNLEYTGGHVGHDQKVAFAQLCVRHHVPVYHHYLDTRPCERFARFVNNPDYRFATMDTTNDLKVLKTSGLSCQKLVNIQGQYRVWGVKKKK